MKNGNSIELQIAGCWFHVSTNSKMFFSQEIRFLCFRVHFEVDFSKVKI